MIYDEILARYPNAFDQQPRYQQPGCDHRGDFARLHQHIDDAAALQHRHLHHVEEIIMAALDDLRAEVEANTQTIDNTVIPALDSLMAAAQNPSGASEEELAALTGQLRDSNARLRDKAQEAAAVVGGAG